MPTLHTGSYNEPRHSHVNCGTIISRTESNDKDGNSKILRTKTSKVQSLLFSTEDFCVMAKCMAIFLRALAQDIETRLFIKFLQLQ